MAISFSCRVDKRAKLKSIYDVDILYTYPNRDEHIPNRLFNKRYLNDGKLYLHFESRFRSDTVVIKSNGKTHSIRVLNTDSSTGVAACEVFDRIADINTISISINNGKEAIFDIDSINHVSINYRRDSVLTIRFLRNVPFYE